MAVRRGDRSAPDTGTCPQSNPSTFHEMWTDQIILRRFQRDKLANIAPLTRLSNDTSEACPVSVAQKPPTGPLPNAFHLVHWLEVFNGQTPPKVRPVDAASTESPSRKSARSPQDEKGRKARQTQPRLSPPNHQPPTSRRRPRRRPNHQLQTPVLLRFAGCGPTKSRDAGITQAHFL